MKAKFTTLDIKILVEELRQKLLGMRVVSVYDIDSKTYLIKLNKTDFKAVLLLESGIRFHTTGFDWPKNLLPSGFSMKLRKHLKGRRLEKVEQLGVDRIVDFQFGSGEAAYHVILEAYDRGNIVLTDFEYTILTIQRQRADNEQDVKFKANETYPVHLAKKHEPVPTAEKIRQILESGKKGDNLKKVLNPHLAYGSHLLEHSLVGAGLQGNMKLGKGFQIERDLGKLVEALNLAEEFMRTCTETERRGYIINEKEAKAAIMDGNEQDFIVTYSEFHPFLFRQHERESYAEFESFDRAVDEFFSKIESQKQEKKVEQQKSAALKKLEHVRLDNKQRIEGLRAEQSTDAKRGLLIELNYELVEEAIRMMRHALAYKVKWAELKVMIGEEARENSMIASIKNLNLKNGYIVMELRTPSCLLGEGDELDLSPMTVDINLEMSAHSNAARYYNMKKHAAVKESKTACALDTAYKSAEKKTMKTLKEVQKITLISKARRSHWFEKFLWFISSENYVVIGGRDQQQNELIVKKYLRPGDIYVHADLNGASSVVIKNPTKSPVPPVTLNEAGTMALCNSAAWDAKVVTGSWWVHHDQVSKTAPTGEYLTTGSFMIRGKKNYLLPSALIYGFGFMFMLDESCVERHRNERRVKGASDDLEHSRESVAVTAEEDDDEEEQVLDLSGDEDDNDAEVVQSSELNEVDCVVSTSEDANVNVKDDNENDESSGSDELVETSEDAEVNGGEEKVGNLSDIQEEEGEDDPQPPEMTKVAEPAGIQRKGSKKQKAPKDDEGEKEKAKAVAANIKQQPVKRGQKSKLKKIKEKYGDQDEEERQMKMEFLASDRVPKEKPSKKKNAKKGAKCSNGTKKSLAETNKQENVKPSAKETKVFKSKPDEISIAANQEEAAIIEEMDEEMENKQIQQEMEVLDSLTGIPLKDDILHYCIPVCAPWTALNNYRFKVKLTPGTSKRGKAAKSVIAAFIQDKGTSALERDLFKSLKDVDISRNMPGKVKVVIAKTQSKK